MNAPATRAVWFPAFVIIVLSIAAIALGAYQWYELAHWRTTAQAPFCTIGAHLDCSRVWDSPLSRSIQRHSVLPVPGWGMVWAAVVLFLAARLLSAAADRRAEWLLSLRLTVGVGVAVVAGLAAYSAALGTFCLTCIGFYALVLLLAFFALRGGGPWTGPWAAALGNCAVPAAVFAALLYYPATLTPLQSAADRPLAAAAAGGTVATGSATLAGYLASLPPRGREAVAQALRAYRREPRVAHPIETGRLIYGTPDAPVHITEWIDIRCPHCRHMEESLEQIRQITPPGAWSWELHHFPLDGECNPAVQRSAGGISCLAAKMMICLRASPRINSLRQAMFRQQQALTKDKLWEMAAPQPDRREVLQHCVDDPATSEALHNDILEAMSYHITGTPLVVVNGRMAENIPAFILSLILARGDAYDPAFSALPGIPAS